MMLDNKEAIQSKLDEMSKFATNSTLQYIKDTCADALTSASPHRDHSISPTQLGSVPPPHTPSVASNAFKKGTKSPGT